LKTVETEYCHALNTVGWLHEKGGIFSLNMQLAYKLLNRAALAADSPSEPYVDTALMHMEGGVESEMGYAVTLAF
jgi:hypothetical protein